MWKSRYYGREVAIKALKIYPGHDVEKVRKVSYSRLLCVSVDQPCHVQRFCEEVITWKALRHPNILPLLGATMTEARFVMISEWMVKGDINKFVKADASADRLDIVRFSFRVLTFAFHWQSHG
jgi:serine/threonine protein kinase